MVDARAQRSRSARRAVVTSSSRTSDRPACSAAAPKASISRASLPTSPNSHRSAARSNRSRTGSSRAATVRHRRRGGRARHDLARRRVGREPGEPPAAPRIGHEADPDGHPPHGDSRVAEFRLDDRRRRTAGNGRPCDRPWQGGEEAVAHLDQAEQPDELHHGHDSHRR